jgi:transcriptional regulator with XRE-family HTH domain
MTVNQRIKIKRQRLGFKQTDLANKVNVSPQVISNWERGYSHPSHDDIYRLSLELGVSSDYLLTGKVTKEVELDEDLTMWLAVGKQLKEEGYDLRKLKNMLTKIIGTFK